jgi:hypothetical protein
MSLREEQKAMRWVIGSGLLGILIAVMLLPIPYMTSQIGRVGFSKPTMDWAYNTYTQNLYKR